MLDWLRASAEWRNWGLNALIVSFFATLVTNAFQFWALIRQMRTIRRARSGQSVSILFFAYMTGLFFSFAVYSFGIRSFGGVLNGLLGIPYFGVILALARVQPFTNREKLLAIGCPFLAVVIAVAPWKEAFMTAIMAVSMIPLAHQAWTMWRNKSAGSVDPRFLAVFTIASTFWVVYAFSIDSLAMRIINPPALAITLVICVLWIRYRPRPSAG